MAIQKEKKEEQLRKLKEEEATLAHRWTAADIEGDLRRRIEEELATELRHHQEVTERKTLKKLTRLNGGSLKVVHQKEGFINLADISLNKDQEELLNLGLNCHVLSKPSHHRKRLELESLLGNILDLESKGKVATTGPILQAAILNESTKMRGNHRSKILQRKHIDAAKELRSNPNIIIRRADKSSTFVLLKKEEYLTKLDSILLDETKFKKITRNPVIDITRRANKLIDAVNARQDGTRLPKIVGDYDLGYLYGNVKTHKAGNPLRPIISQIPTPTYNLAKRLAQILTPFVPSHYSIASSTEFLELVRSNHSDGIIASLDVESLFTNVPVDRTIDYILKKVYEDGPSPAIDIPREVMKSLLSICTKEAPFRCPRGTMYQQIDGIAMGSPLGVLFANFFMGCIEEEVFSEIDFPTIYCRYVDDTFVKITDGDALLQLKNIFEEKSGLRFTIERSDQGQLPFLDVLLTQQQGIETSVYVKENNSGHCLNGASECPSRYLESTASAYIRRALSHCSTWASTHKELERAAQQLVDNGFTNDTVKKVTRRILDRWYNNQTNDDNREEGVVTLYYKSHMNTAYKEDERIIRDIISSNVSPAGNTTDIKTIIYYQSKKTSHLLLRNNLTPRPAELQRTNLIYKHICQNEDCRPHTSSYIGMTTTRLSRRISNHLQSGTIKRHYLESHGVRLTREDMEAGTTILDYETNPGRLAILEALYIKEEKPRINLQYEELFILPSLKRPRPAPNIQPL